jgi:hypothetical protein
MTGYKKLFIVAAVLGVVGFGASVFGIANSSFSPNSYVSSHYTRAARYDLGRDARAYTSARSPLLVSQQITKAWRPTYRYNDGSGYYLRYGDDSVVIRPQGAGSLILLEKMRTANARYFGVVGNTWHYTTRQNSSRGGGSGTGK